MTRRVVGFVDGQNLFYAAKQAFGYTYPNYDPRRLTEVVAGAQGWTVAGIRFYTGVPDRSNNPFWNGFWAARCDAMGSEGVVAFTRPLRYRDETVDLPGGGKGTARIGREKGIDVRMALDVVRLVRSGACDVALLLSQDQDLSEVADEMRAIALGQGRWIKMACAFPVSATYPNRRGIAEGDVARLRPLSLANSAIRVHNATTEIAWIAIDKCGIFISSIKRQTTFAVFSLNGMRRLLRSRLLRSTGGPTLRFGQWRAARQSPQARASRVIR